LRARTKQSILMAISPIVKLRPRNIMASCNLSYRHAVAKAFLNDTDLFVIRPTAATAGIRDRQNLNAGGVFVCVHKDTR
jgi:hypothetical protein